LSSFEESEIQNLYKKVSIKILWEKIQIAYDVLVESKRANKKKQE
jgi:hypothetical protein